MDRFSTIFVTHFRDAGPTSYRKASPIQHGPGLALEKDAKRCAD